MSFRPRAWRDNRHGWARALVTGRGGAGSSISEALGSANTILERLFQWREEQRRALELGENLNADAMLDGFDAAALGESMR